MHLCYVITFLIVVAFAGQVRAVESQPSEKIPVVASFSILADFARQLGGERVKVTALVGPNGDTHVYQPKPSDAKELAAARLLLVNGLGLEGWIDRLITASKSKARVVIVTRGIKPQEMREEGRVALDPHAWQTIANAKIYVANIRDGLIAVDPSGAEIYRAHAEDYLEKLSALEDEVKAAIGQIPPERREIITTHDAFGYFGTAYGFKFIAPEGVSTETEASAGDVAKIIRQIKAQKIPAVFLENIVDPRLLRSIATESGAKIGGTLYSDALSPPDGPAATYIDMMHNNVGALSEALRP